MDEMDSDRTVGGGVRLEFRREELEEFRRLVAEPPARREARLAAISAAASSLAERLRRLLDSVAEELEVRDHETADPNLGRSIGAWRLERLLGRGASARVYLATGDGSPPEVALKLFDRSDLGPGFRRRLAREVEALRRIDHPGVVRFVAEGIDEASGRPWLAMEFVPDAMGIVDRVTASAATLEERAQLVGQMRTALAAAHAAGVVHRDLSPRNVLVDGEGRVKIVDFGIASVVHESISSQGTVSATVIAGTPATMAPEQVDRSFGPIGPWTDEYAAAATAYRLFTGRYPYDTSGSLASIAQAIVHVPARPVRELEPGVPEGIAEWVDAGLVKSPSRRASALRESKCSALPVNPRTAGSDRRWKWAMTGTLIVLLTGWWGVQRWGVRMPAETDEHETARGAEENQMRNQVLAGVLSIGCGMSAFAGGSAAVEPAISFPIQGASSVNNASAVYGDLAIFGAPGHSGGGVAYRCIRENGNWTVAGTFLPPSARAAFGMGIDMNDNWVLVCDPNVYGGRGAAHLWRRQGSELIFHQTLVASDGAGGDAFGWNACLNGSELFVNARLDDNWQGSIYRFSLGANGLWSQSQKIQSVHTNGGDEFGWMMRASGDLLVATDWLSECYYDNPTGQLHVFRRAANGNHELVFWTGDSAPGCTNFGHTGGTWGEEVIVNQGQPPRMRRFAQQGSGWVERPAVDGVNLIWGNADSALVYDEPRGGWFLVYGPPTTSVGGVPVALPAGLTGNNIYHAGDPQSFSAICYDPAGAAFGVIWNLNPDCDADGTPDAAEIAKGEPDVNSNGIPDSCECLGDVDSSGSANAIDIAIILGVWGTAGGKYPAADIDGSGNVDAQDLTVVLGSWGPCP